MQVFINNTDISNYVTSIADIPISATNKDLSLYFPSINLDIAETIATAPKEGDNITIKILNTTHKTYYKGYLSNINYDYKKCVYKCKVLNLLNKLKNEKIKRDDLYDNIIAGRDYDSSQTYIPENFDFSTSQKWVNCIYLAKVMIEKATGETVNTTRLNSIMDYWKHPSGRSIFKFRMFIPPLWSAGQEKARNWNDIENSTEYKKLRSSYYEILKPIFILLKIHITYEDDKYYFNHISDMIDDATGKPIDNLNFGYKKDIYINKYRGWKSNLQVPDELISVYESSSSGYEFRDAEYSSLLLSGSEPAKNISFPTNLLIFSGVTDAMLTSREYYLWMVYTETESPQFIQTYEFIVDYIFRQYSTLKTISSNYFNNFFSIKKEESKYKTIDLIDFRIVGMNFTNGETGIPTGFEIIVDFSSAVLDNCMTVKIKDITAGNVIHDLIPRKITDTQYGFKMATSFNTHTNYLLEIYGISPNSTNFKNIYNRELLVDIDYLGMEFTTGDI